MTSTYRKIRVGENQITEKIYLRNYRGQGMPGEISKIQLDVRIIEVPLYIIRWKRRHMPLLNTSNRNYSSEELKYIFTRQQLLDSH